MKNKILVIGLVCMFLLSLSINVEKTTANPGSITFDFDLYEGYNLVTIPVDNVYTASTLADNITGFNIVSQNMIFKLLMGEVIMYWLRAILNFLLQVKN